MIYRTAKGLAVAVAGLRIRRQIKYLPVVFPIVGWRLSTGCAMEFTTGIVMSTVLTDPEVVAKFIKTAVSDPGTLPATVAK